MQSDAMKQEEIEALAREMAKGVKTEADLEAVTRTLTKTLIETPRDRNGDFEPQLVRKRQRRVTVIDE